MRKEDIIVTTPKHSTIYAFGTSPESYDGPWADLDAHGHANKLYRPAYVLEVRDSGFVTVLVCDVHPEYQYRGYGGEPASLLEATEYTLADHVARQEFMAKHSHWATDEEREVYREGLEKLKPLPARWQVRTERSTYIRLLWAEYTERHGAKIAERKAARDAERAEKEALKDVRRSSLKRLAKLKIGYKKGEIEESLRSSWGKDTDVKVPADILAKLLDRYESTMVAESKAAD